MVHAGPLDSTFERMNNFNKNDWSFQIASTGETARREQFDPRQEPQWALVEINSEPPSEQQLAPYFENKDKQQKLAEEKNRDTGKLNLHEMIDIESLTLIEDDVDSAKYSFKPIIDDDEGIAESLKGELWHNKQYNFIERFVYFNTEDFSPMTGVKIKRMYSSFKFKQIDENTFAPDQISMEVSGKAFVFKKIDDKASQTYSQYQQVNKQ